jgi:hypothetical protein
MLRTSGLSCRERGRMLVDLVLDAVCLKPIEQAPVRSGQDRLIAAHSEPPNPVAGWLQGGVNARGGNIRVSASDLRGARATRIVRRSDLSGGNLAA